MRWKHDKRNLFNWRGFKVNWRRIRIFKNSKKTRNAEYDAARGEQATVEAKIVELEQMIEHAVIIKEVKTDKVSIGNNVKIEYVEDKETEEYSIVGSKEADPFNNRISNESPIAQAIIGKKVGDIVKVASPNGEYEVKILEIS